MFQNVAIDVSLGIVFVLLTYSLLASIVQELVARWLGLRARLLQKAIRRMLEDGDSNHNSTLVNFVIDTIDTVVRYFRPLKKNSITRAFYEYPLIKYLGENNWSSKPSYISGRNFSETMIHLLRGDGYDGTQNQMTLINNNLFNNSLKGAAIDQNTIAFIKRIWIDSNHDIERFAAGLEAWYNDTMMRVTGWYKRQTQLILFLIGLSIAIIFNVDIIAIAQILSKNNAIREQVVTMAANHQKNYTEVVKELNAREVRPGAGLITSDTVRVFVSARDSVVENAYRKLSEDAADMQKVLGLGREKECREDTVCMAAVDRLKDSLARVGKLDQKKIMELCEKYAACKNCTEKKSPYQDERWKIWGWLLTALSISLGAPFWFDLLNKIMLLRGAGARPKDETTDNPDNSNAVNTRQPPVKPKG